MTEIYVEHARIEAAAAQLHSHKQTFDHVLAQLESDLAPMIASWSGESQAMYLIKKKAWDLAALDLTNVLASIAKLTGDAHTNYVQTVNDVKTLWT